MVYRFCQFSTPCGVRFSFRLAKIPLSDVS